MLFSIYKPTLASPDYSNKRLELGCERCSLTNQNFCWLFKSCRIALLVSSLLLKTMFSLGSRGKYWISVLKHIRLLEVLVVLWWILRICFADFHSLRVFPYYCRAVLRAREHIGK